MTHPSTITTLTGNDALASAASVWQCYERVFDASEGYAAWRSGRFDPHVAMDGYRLVVALDGDSVIGFSWGYLGRRGQYWAEVFAEALPPDLASAWVGDHFELFELGVLPGYRRQGWGTALLEQALDGVTRRCLLVTEDDPGSPAVQMYLRLGWTKLGLLREGVQVMGLDRG